LRSWAARYRGIGTILEAALIATGEVHRFEDRGKNANVQNEKDWGNSQ